MAAKKGFKQDNPLNKMEGNVSVKITDPATGRSSSAASKKTKPIVKLKKDGTPAKSNAGRKVTKTEPTHTTNVDISQELFDKFLMYKQCVGGTMTAYINNLIRKDMEVNEKKYKKALEILNSIQ